MQEAGLLQSAAGEQFAESPRSGSEMYGVCRIWTRDLANLSVPAQRSTGSDVFGLEIRRISAFRLRDLRDLQSRALLRGRCTASTYPHTGAPQRPHAKLRTRLVALTPEAQGTYAVTSEHSPQFGLLHLALSLALAITYGCQAASCWSSGDKRLSDDTLL